VEYLWTATSLMAEATAVAGVVLFALAARLPSALPDWFARLMGVIVVAMSLYPFWVETEDWRPPTVLGAGCLLAFIIIHFVQMRREKADRGK